jgi:3-phosphoshikimate 1-carboxyvinyltransferase
MGCAVVETAEGVAVHRDGGLSGLDADMNEVPDLVPTIAAVALFADTPSRISNVAHLRYKESDRLRGLADELRRLGADITVSHDGLLIRPHALEGALLDPHDDHRLAMSFALIGLRVGGISVKEPECVRKSFPAFWEEFESLYET